MSGVTLITCTGGRQQAFNLCRWYVERQTYAGAVQWIVVDDCDPPTPMEASARYEMRLLYPVPLWKPGQMTLARNLLEAIQRVEHDKVLFIEDDDWYAPDYVERMVEALRGHDIAAETHARFYHVPDRRWQVQGNGHAGLLCQTGIHRNFLPYLEAICRDPHVLSLDGHLWQHARELNLDRGLLPAKSFIGIKGLPGRPGSLGTHSRAFLSDPGKWRGAGRSEYSAGWTNDPSMAKLREWIGEDVELYKEFVQ